MIGTVFYFVQNMGKDEYTRKVDSGHISPRTIVLSKENRAIFAQGEQYGNISVEDVASILNQIFQDKTVELPIATGSSLGAIMVGDYLRIDTKGLMGIDAERLITSPYIQRYINDAILEKLNTSLPVATKGALGCVIVGEHLSVNNGKISVDIDDIADILASDDDFIRRFKQQTEDTFVLNPASSLELGGIKIGYSLQGNRYGVQLDSQNRAFVEVPSTGNSNHEKTTVSWNGIYSSSDGDNVTAIGTLSVDGQPSTVYIPKASSSNTNPSNPTNNGEQKAYFINVASGITPSKPSVSEYTSADSFVHGSDHWSATNTNPSEELDTWAIWVWFLGSTPVTISGPVKIYNGSGSSSNGEDGEEIEWIYTRSTVEWDSSTISQLATELARYNGTSKITSSANIGGVTWYDHPSGIDQTNKYEYASYRLSTNDSNGQRVWGVVGFSSPLLWSAYGKTGTDGDGVEYIYYANTIGTIPAGQYPNEWAAVQTPEYTGPNGSLWSDDPVDIQTLGQGAKEWVCVRKKQDGNWGTFSDPALWAYYAEDGSDGIVDGYIVALTNENMPVVTNSNGSVTSYTNTCGIEVYHNGFKENNFSASIGAIVRSDGVTVNNNIAATYSNGIVTVTMTNVSDFVGVNAFIPVTVTLPNDSTRSLIITLYGVNGSPGESYDLYVSSFVVRKDHYGTVITPQTIDVGVRVGDNMYSAGSTEAANLGFTFDYAYDFDSSYTPLNTYQLSTSGEHSVITVRLKHNNNVVDAKTILYVIDGAPGIGTALNVYQIHVLSNTMTVAYADNHSLSVHGSVEFTVVKNNTDNMTTNPWEDSDSETLSIAVSKNQFSSLQYDSTKQCWIITVPSNVSFDSSFSYTAILLKSQTNTVLATAVIPFIIPGYNGKDGADGNSVQSINGSVIRMHTWEHIDDNEYIYAGDTVSSDGTIYIDVVLYDGNYYRPKPNQLDAPMTKATLGTPIVSGSISQKWIAFDYGDSAAYLTIIANAGFIKDLTSREIVITDGDNNPVAGLTSGKAYRKDDSSALGEAERGDIRIWAGNPTKAGVTNLMNCPFYVTNTGHVNATDATVKGNILATSFEVMDPSINQPSIEFTTVTSTMVDTYSGIANSGLNVGEPIAILYTYPGGVKTATYFFDFAPVGNSGGTSYTLKRYLLSDTGITETSSYYYNESGEFYSDQSGTNLANDSNTTYLLTGSKWIFARHRNNESLDIFITNASRYEGYTYSNGIASSTGEVYYRVVNVDGGAYWLATPMSTHINNPNENIKTNFGGTILANTSSGIQFEQQEVTLMVLDTIAALLNLHGTTITTWNAGLYYISTSNESA